MVEKWRSASEEDTERGRRLLDWPEETLFANCPCKLHAYGNICLVDALPLTNWARGCVSSLFGQRERCFVKKSYWAIKKIERSACRGTWRTSLAPFPRKILTLMGDIWQTAILRWRGGCTVGRDFYGFHCANIFITWIPSYSFRWY